MRRVIFTQAARSELIEAQDWYEGERADLRRRSRSEVDRTVERIADGPLRFPRLFSTVRHAVLERFSYDLIFSTDNDSSVTIVACFHSSRDPAQWRKRI